MKPIRAARSLLALLMMAFAVGSQAHPHHGDVLAVGDASDDSVRFFSARTGKPLQDPAIGPGSGGLHGPRGIVFDQQRREWLVANQNVDQRYPGEILRYDANGRPLGALVSRDAPGAPYAPRGIVLAREPGAGATLFVADMGDIGLPGKLLAYRVHGGQASLIANLDPNLARPGTTGQFHPRAVVIGPDGYLYVSLSNLPDDPSVPYACGGSVVRFDPKRLAFKDVLISNPAGCSANVNDLHHPEGLVFSPRGDLYITSGSDPRACECFYNDEILVVPKADRRGGPRLPLERIDLAPAGQPLVGAQALLFGPGGHLFVPIPATGEVRRYNVDTKAYWTFVPAGRGVGSPWYLSFAATDPATLVYGDD